MSDRTAWELPFTIEKRLCERQWVFGWLSCAVDKDGHFVVDGQDDVIFPEDLEEAAYNHVLHFRETDAMHRGDAVGKLIDSVVITPQKFAAWRDKLGIDPSIVTKATAWWVGYRVDNPVVWQRVVSGELRAFSIGGYGTREDLPRAP